MSARVGSSGIAHGGEATGVDEARITNNPDLLDAVLGDAALSGDEAAQQADRAYQDCLAGL
jgi:hypothetical protein